MTENALLNFLFVKRSNKILYAPFTQTINDFIRHNCLVIRFT
jgi:hypothetical protein